MAQDRSEVVAALRKSAERARKVQEHAQTLARVREGGETVVVQQSGAPAGNAGAPSGRARG